MACTSVDVAMGLNWSYDGQIYTMADSDRTSAEAAQPGDTMASLARRACYKCGTVGHFAGMSLDLVANPCGLASHRSRSRQRSARQPSACATTVSASQGNLTIPSRPTAPI